MRTGLVALGVLVLLGAGAALWARGIGGGATAGVGRRTTAQSRPAWDRSSAGARRLAQAAMSQVGVTIRYDASYTPIAYPGGDVPIDRGACTDVVIRAFRAMGIDLQVEVHEDMLEAFSHYPHLWGLTAPDPNIDQRRVPNLQVFFTRMGKSLPVTRNPKDYWPGDVVTWSVPGSHIGIVSTDLDSSGTRYCVVHNIGSGVRIQDRLFAYPITGHYRWY